MSTVTSGVNPSRWLRGLFRRSSRIDPEHARDYQAAVTPLLERADCLYQQWVEQVESLTDDERIANIASIQGWEMASLAERLGACTPPPGLETVHANCTRAFELARRAGRLLSTGYRYHSTDALCDGHASLDDARQLYLSAMARLIELSSPPESDD
jgi:hypothetical protein